MSAIMTSSSLPITYHHTPLTAQPGTTIFHRQSGDTSKPTMLLLHGFPSSSHQFRQLIPLLSHKYNVIAPDLPGFGLTTVGSDYQYTFANLADSIDAWLTQLNVKQYTVYIFDYGAPVGLRVALKRPEQLAAIISQNGNAYEEGLTSGWNSIKKYWQDDTAENRNALRKLLTPEMIKWQYTHGLTDQQLQQLSPDGYLSDTAFLQRPGQADIQLDLFRDYRTNVTLYPEFQRMFQQTNVPILALWGSHDPFFGPAGAEAYKRHSSKAEVYMLETGHFALETHVNNIAEHIIRFFGQHLV